MIIRDQQPFASEDNRQSYKAIGEFARNTTVPPRFGVLAGEIVHHLRAALDHVAWQLSSIESRMSDATAIEFPVFKEAPTNCGITKDKISRYCRKIKGISSPTALTRIEALQPYHRGQDSADHPLWLVHDMDRTDKHRELLIIIAGARTQISATAQRQVIPEYGTNGMLRLIPLIGATNVNVRGKLFAEIAFAQVGKRENQAVIPTLQQLAAFSTDTLESFAGEFV